MDTKDYSTEHRKWQHLFSEERHEIEVRLKDGWSIYRIAKHLGRPYNTIKNEVARGSVKLYRGKVVRYKADVGEKTYTENRSRSRRQVRPALPFPNSGEPQRRFLSDFRCAEPPSSSRSTAAFP